MKTEIMLERMVEAIEDGMNKHKAIQAALRELVKTHRTGTTLKKHLLAIGHAVLAITELKL